jgi:hypothetical protein
MVFPKVKKPDEFKIIVNDVVLENVNECKYLEITWIMISNGLHILKQSMKDYKIY